ncbi:hypothetical protein LXL04_005225 [Taraxacum kok-saghyz]
MNPQFFTNGILEIFQCVTPENTSVNYPGKCVTTVVIYYSYTRYIGNTDSDTDIQYRQAASVFKEICTETSLSHATPNLMNRPHPVSGRLRATDHWVNQQPRPGRIEPAPLLRAALVLTIRTTEECALDPNFTYLGTEDEIRRRFPSELKTRTGEWFLPSNTLRISEQADVAVAGAVDADAGGAEERRRWCRGCRRFCNLRQFLCVTSKNSPGNCHGSILFISTSSQVRKSRGQRRWAICCWLRQLSSRAAELLSRLRKDERQKMRRKEPSIVFDWRQKMWRRQDAGGSEPSASLQLASIEAASLQLPSNGFDWSLR